ncbi:YhgE/Pip domain-containing protein [Bacillus horti]|uniref:X-X-X-Leu-X-X-Gly heptad repeat protein n=1 Tax=Caldalkalibacillus horti TaxID=77523 RepID=A0ABT9VWF1_9BACI|nr:YhgE/Pip domain-containing protein [Bacillus horti]MDQ0165325.1 X-X-X-Leu-X-X-Gly heptad repeat protein [Bacillus horti]
MRSIRKYLLILMTILLLLPSWSATTANSNSSTSQEDASTEMGEVSSKDEVVYATLNPSGKSEHIYVVNILDVAKAGEITDFGQYSSLKNLSNLSLIEQQDDSVSFVAPEGKFYYQGNIDDDSLPWNFSISYWLDGEEIAPDELIGENGDVQIQIETSANASVNPIFFENYLLQISVSFDLEKFKDIKAPDGVFANAGKNKQITFTVMPEQEETLLLEANVTDFELAGIDIAAVPFSMSVELPDMDSMTGDFATLSDAIEEVHNGITELLNGITELHDGASELRSGSREYRDGIAAINDSSADLVQASATIGEALKTLDQSLRGSLGEGSLDELQQLEDGLMQMANGLREMATGLETLGTHFGTSYEMLNNAMEEIPEHDVTEEDIQQLYASGANRAVLDKLISTYAAAQKAKGTYNAVKESFDAMETTLKQVNGSLTEMAGQMTGIAAELSAPTNQNPAESLAQLQEGISSLAQNYEAFHTGLEDYTGGIGQLSNSYGELDQGIEGLTDGIGELKDGVGELHAGTAELSSSTRDLPDQMKDEVDQLMADYDHSDFEVVSFVSQENENINLVQFVFRTADLKHPEPEVTENQAEEKEGFWNRFINLFRDLF